MKKKINWSHGETKDSIRGKFVVIHWDCGCQLTTPNGDHNRREILCDEHSVDGKLPSFNHRNMF